MNKTEIINFLIEKLNYQTYLEIGIFNEENFGLINVPKKYLVNSCLDGIYNINVNYYQNSNEFFKNNNNNNKYDIILIDAFHDSQIVDTEIKESLCRLNENGCIVVHDTNPDSYDLQITPCQKLPWTGDVWRSIIKLKNQNNIQYYTVDSDFGCTIIKKHDEIKNNRKYDIEEIDWFDFQKNKKELLKIISVEEFVQKFI